MPEKERCLLWIGAVGIVFLVILSISIPITITKGGRRNKKNATGRNQPRGCESKPNNAICFEASSASDFYFHSDKGLNEVASKVVRSEDECLDFCSSYPAASYLLSTDSCVCYEDINCLLPWGDQVNFEYYFGFGYMYTKKKQDICDMDWCDLNPNHWFCLTGHRVNHDSKTFYGANLNKVNDSLDTDSEQECLEFCAEYDGAHYLPFSNKDKCTCFNNVDCLVPWGDQVDTSEVEFGYVFTKEDVGTCGGFDYCDKNKNDWICFTGQKVYHDSKTLYGTNLNEVDSTDTFSEQECLESCAEYDGVIHFWSGRCTCFNNVDCLVSWGDQVDTSEVEFGYVFTKTDVGNCDGFDYCDKNKNDWACFTGNTADYDSKTLYGANLNEMDSTDTYSEQECLEFCADYDGVIHHRSSSKCTCFNNVDCLVPWGDQVDTSEVGYGTVFTKEDVGTCDGFDYCDNYLDDPLCV